MRHFILSTQAPPITYTFATSFRWLSIFVVVFLLNFRTASAQDKIILVCVTDARNGANLGNVSVNINTGQETFSGTTISNGCVYLSGQIPVANEVDHTPGPGLDAGAPFPNPASENISLPIRANQSGSVSLDLYDVHGRQISSNRRFIAGGSTQEFDVDVSRLADGVYFYRMRGAAGQVTGEFIKMASAPASATTAPLAASGASLAGHLSQPVSRADSVTVEVTRNGFVTYSERRVLSNFDQLNYSLFKSTDNRIPVMDMFGVKYLGVFEGGLYPDQTNEIPEAHFNAGLLRAASIEPLDIAGNPDANGKIVFTSIGMSTTSSMFCGVADPAEPCKEGTFMRVLKEDASINTQLEVIDGADPGKTTEKWEASDSKTFDRVLEEELEPIGLSELQIQAAWVNLASSGPTSSLPNEDADAFLLEQQYGNVMRALSERYPNLKLVFFASRVYGGYATSEINPEPYAYESGLAVKWAIEAQIKQMHDEGAPIDAETGNLDYTSVAPWMAWGPYLWADGPNPRSDGVIWLPEDLKDDGTHLARIGIEKTTPIFLNFFKTSRLTRCWFLENGGACE
ncbi:MAG: T9SS type A sorting domain-containing protein [Rhodothermales bacterium]